MQTAGLTYKWDSAEAVGAQGTGERTRHVVKNGMQTGWGRGRGQANADTQEKYRQSIAMILKNRKCGKEGYWDL